MPYITDEDELDDEDIKRELERMGVAISSPCPFASRFVHAYKLTIGLLWR